MKKAISIIAVCICMILPGGLFGCAPKEDKEAIIGEWIWRITAGGQLNFLKYTFNEDGTAEYQHSQGSSTRFGNYTYKLNGKSELVLITDGKLKNYYPYSFNEDFTVLTLMTVDGDKIEFSKNITGR